MRARGNASSRLQRHRPARPHLLSTGRRRSTPEHVVAVRAQRWSGCGAKGTSPRSRGPAAGGLAGTPRTAEARSTPSSATGPRAPERAGEALGVLDARVVPTDDPLGGAPLAQNGPDGMGGCGREARRFGADGAAGCPRRWAARSRAPRLVVEPGGTRHRRNAAHWYSATGFAA